ncbi:MAG: asparagine synthase (glutamine-hydrolyzing) [Sphingobacteriales bacterium]|nr:asparagine synthase (glutamine-hydrolyzing) [Sphingobacteriales bacterium]
MCGIAGIVGPEKSQYPVRQMLQSIAHRGPDGCFYHQDSNFDFGHARLSIIDLSTDANQPMTDPANGNVIIFNGEIYNYRELKADIGDRYAFRTTSDTESILAAFACYGMSFLEKLRGMFAFALYEKKSGKVLIVRDRFGIKPLYYRSLKGALLFASEIKAIVAVTPSQNAVNSFKAYEFLANCQLDTDEQTLFSEVYQLKPAHYAWIEPSGAISTSTRYWQFPEPGNRRFNEQAEDELIEVFSESIRLHIRSDVPVGCFVSGGIDSSAVASFAIRNLEQEKMHTFSAVLPYHHPENALITDLLQTSDRYVPHQFLLDGNDFFKDIPALIYHHDEPTMDGSMYAHYKLCEMAGQKGIKVLLSGSGGDELFGGYSSHLYAQLAKLLSTGRFTKYFKDVLKLSKHSGLPKKDLLVKSLYEQIPLSVRRGIKRRQIRSRNPHLTIAPDFPHYYHRHNDPYFSNMVNNYLSWSAPPFLHYEDRNSMAFGVETRVPFFDHKLIEFIIQFASEDIIDGKSKSLLRKSFQQIVPETILQQKGKYGFPSPIDHALKGNAEGKALFFNLAGKTDLLRENETTLMGKRFYEGNGDLSAFWRTLSYMIWYQIFFTKDSTNLYHDAKTD